MYCGNCGNEIKEGEKFCGRCGVPVEQSAETPVVPRSSKQPKATSIGQISFSTKSNILAVISAALLLISMNLSYVSFQIVNWSFKLCDVYDYAISEFESDYTVFYFLYMLIFVGIFLYFKLTNRRVLSFIGCIGILIEVAALLFVTYAFSIEASDYSMIYSFGLGLYMHIAGLIVLLVSAIMKD